MNDNLSGYSRTCVLNMCFSINPEVRFLMQVIGNFRKVIRQHMVSFTKLIEYVKGNANAYIDLWRKNMLSVCTGVSPCTVWDPFDRSSFFLDDNLPFKTMNISYRKSEGEATLSKITGEYLLTRAGFSRVTSLSMFINPIMQLKGQLCTDQSLELLFFSSLQTNPFWFHHVMSRLANERKHPFGEHPMYDVINELYSTFGTWQGGPHGRWSPCGGTVPVVELFGAQPNATPTEKATGVERLERIVGILFRHLEWINSLQGQVEDPIRDLPPNVLQKHFESIRKTIHNVIPCQFSLFRLSVFTTLAIGCNELMPGPHLKHLMVPMRGTGSYKHALGVTDNNVDPDSRPDLDCLMLYLSSTLGRPQYVRDKMECVLCETNPNRKECYDWFTKGLSTSET